MASCEMHRHRPLKLIVPRQLSFESFMGSEIYDRSLSNRSSISVTNIQDSSKPRVSSSSLHQSFNTRSISLQIDPSIDIVTNSSDDENDFDDSVSARENYRFGSQAIRHRRQNSSYSISQQQRAPTSRRSDVLVIQAPPPGKTTASARYNSLANGGSIPMVDQQVIAAVPTINSYKDLRGQTLLHLAARLGHDEILRLLICETSQASILMNTRGQTPLLIAIESGSTSTATLLMESDPRSIIVSDNNGSSVFHYACEHCNDVVLNRAIALLKRLSSTSDRIIVSLSS
jgi:hypothetical protein